MEGRRKAALVAVGIVFFVVLLSANAVVTLDRTAFDVDHATESAEEAGLYESLATQIRSQITAQAPDSAADSPLNRSQSELIAAAITDEYVETQTEQNIENVYAYLNGETDELQVGFDTEPVEQNLLEEVESEVEDIDLAAIDMPFAGEIEAMASNRSSFERHRASFRAEQKQRIQERTDRELSDEELETRLNESMGEIREQMLTRLDSQLEGRFEGPEAALAEPVRDLQAARINALTGELTYEEYASEVETAREDLGDAFVTIFESRLGEQVPDTIDVTEQMTDQQRQTLETARTVVSLSGPAAIGLVVLAIALAALVAWLAPRSIAAMEVGIVSGLVGIIGVVGSVVATDQFRAIIAGDTGAPAAMEAFAREFVVGIFEALRVQSAILLVVGVVLVAVGIAIRREYISV
jgi:hypothetical protein